MNGNAIEIVVLERDPCIVRRPLRAVRIPASLAQTVRRPGDVIGAIPGHGASGDELLIVSSLPFA